MQIIRNNKLVLQAGSHVTHDSVTECIRMWGAGARRRSHHATKPQLHCVDQQSPDLCKTEASPPEPSVVQKSQCSLYAWACWRHATVAGKPHFLHRQSTMQQPGRRLKMLVRDAGHEEVCSHLRCWSSLRGTRDVEAALAEGRRRKPHCTPFILLPGLYPGPASFSRMRMKLLILPWKLPAAPLLRGHQDLSLICDLESWEEDNAGGHVADAGLQLLLSYV